MISRRDLLTATAATALVACLPRFALAANAPLRVASVKFGTLAWLLETIKAEGIDKKNNLTLDVIELANNQASPITLYGGSADVIVSDWTWAMKQLAMGEKLKFAPFSSALGAVVVPADSPIKTLADLEGKRLGVAGSAVDKSWLLLRAFGSKEIGKDLADIVTPQYGAAPLLAEQLKDGKLDAVLNFWTYSARLRGLGFRSIITMSEVMQKLGIDPKPSMVGFIWKADTEAARGADIAAFLTSVADGNSVLATSDVAWERLRPLMKATNEEEFSALKTAYRGGIPGPWSDADMKSAEKIMNLLVEAGDKELVGNGTRFDPKLFHTART